MVHCVLLGNILFHDRKRTLPSHFSPKLIRPIFFAAQTRLSVVIFFLFIRQVASPITRCADQHQY